MQIPSKFKPFLEDPKIHNIFEGGRGATKTRTIANIIIEVMNQAPLAVICGREIQKSLKESSFLVLKQEIYRLGYGQRFKIIESQGVIESAAGGRAVFIGLQQHTVDSIKSYESFHWVWIEEAQSVSKQSLETLIPTLRTDGWFEVDVGIKLKFPLRMFLYTLNPYTWDDPINLVLPQSRDDTRRIKINYYDNPWFPKSLEAERIEAKSVMTPDEYLRIWEGIPFDNAENAVITRTNALSAMERTVSTDGGIVIGADIARFGSDRTVFIKRQGLQVIGMKILQKKDTQEVARQLFDYSEGGRIIIDDTGVGGGVTDKLRDLGGDVVPINFGAAAQNKKKYPDIISEMWFNLAGLIESVGLPNNPELLAELSSRHYRYTPDERRKVESKDDFKKRTGRNSPDCFIEGTMIKTVKGDVPIEKIKEGDRIFTPFGIEKVIKTWENSTNKLTKATFENGKTITGKQNHRLFTINRFTPLDSVLGESVECFSWKKIILNQMLKFVFMKAQNITFKHLVDTITQERDFMVQDCFIGESGLNTSEQSRKETAYTILMGIGETILSLIFSQLKQVFTPRNICITQVKKQKKKEWKDLKRQDLKLQNGTHQKMGYDGTQNKGKSLGKIESGKNTNVPIVGMNTKLMQKNLVAQSVGIKDSLKIAPLLKKRALFVEKFFKSKVFYPKKRCVAVDRVQLRCDGVTVYNLTLEKHNVYYANGFLVENCADALILCYYNREPVTALF